MLKRIMTLCVCSGLALGAPLTSAQPSRGSAQPSADDAAAALALGREGLEALEKKDYAAAAELFARADARYHAPTLVLGLARAQVGLGRLVAARETYQRIVHEGVPRGAPPHMAKAVEDAKQEMAALEARVPSILITVSGPADPTVTLDGVPVAREALGQKRPVDPGEHTVRASASGYVAREMKLTIREGDAAAAPLVLMPEPPERRSEPARSHGAPAAGEAPRADAPPRQGGEPPDQGSQRGGSLRATLGVISLGAGIGALGMGAGMAGVALADDADLQELCPGFRCPSWEQSRVEGYDRARKLAVGALAAGGVCAGAGVTLLLASGDAEPAPLQRRFGQGLVGAGVSGLALGAITGALSLSVGADLDGCTETTCPPAQQGARESASSLRTLSIIGLGAGAASLGAGIALWATAPSARGDGPAAPAKSGALELAPYVGPLGGGVLGRF
ncbi:tetratricopeptide repeat protein [Sorangium sp. So ce1128]